MRWPRCQGFRGFLGGQEPRGGQEVVGPGDLVQEVARRPGHQEVAKRSGRQGSGAQIMSKGARGSRRLSGGQLRSAVVGCVYSRRIAGGIIRSDAINVVESKDC